MNREDFFKHIGNVNRYALLDRMRSDCEYWLGFGNRYNKILWGKNPVDHIQYMKWLWESFDEDQKPEWLTMEEIETYEKRMSY